VTRNTYTATILMGRVSGFRLGIEQGNKLPFDNINPEDKWRDRIPLGLNKAMAFRQYQSRWQQVIWTSQICGSECQGFTRTMPLVLTKMQVIDVAFSLRTQAIQGPPNASGKASIALMNHPSS